MKRFAAPLLAAIALLPMVGGPGKAQTLDHPDAFERSFATSFYQFDACGDPLAGRMFRKALAERFAQCPFTAPARSRYQQRTRQQQAKIGATIESMIDANGGLPQRLDGMEQTCHQQQTSEGYVRYRHDLEEYASSRATAESVIPTQCSAPSLEQ